MATKKETEKQVEPIELPRRLHINEFIMAHTTNLNAMHKAGLQALAGDKKWMTKDEWQAILDGYIGKKE